MVFFLPLAGTIIHVAFAFPVITKMLAAFRLTNITLIFLCTLVDVVVYAPGLYRRLSAHRPIIL